MSVRRKQAHKQAPWRLQIRSMGGTALSIVCLLIIGGVYLAVNAKLARAGREVLVLEKQKTTLTQDTSLLMAELAAQTAPDRMLALATGLGFRPARIDEVEFLAVSGYQPEEPFQAPRPLATHLDYHAALSPAYSETLGEWIVRLLRGSD